MGKFEEAYLELGDELKLFDGELRWIARLVDRHQQIRVVVLAVDQLAAILQHHILVVLIGRRGALRRHRMLRWRPVGRRPFGFADLIQPEEVGVLLQVLVVDVGGDLLQCPTSVKKQVSHHQKAKNLREKHSKCPAKRLTLA